MTLFSVAMNISIIGTGYVGLVTGAVLADHGNKAICVDIDEKIVNALNEGKTYISEPGLDDLIKRNVAQENLRATTDVEEAVSQSDVIFLTVDTPSNDDGSSNLESIKEAARNVGQALRRSTTFKVVVGKSTVPPDAHKTIIDIIGAEVGESHVNWAYVANPETLAEGTAIQNFSAPDRTIIGTYSNKAFDIMEELYHPYHIREGTILRGTPVEAEIAKLGANALLAARINVINEISQVADLFPDADMSNIRMLIGEDSRIGTQYLFAGPGWGGSCFPKDVTSLVYEAQQRGLDLKMISQINPSNEAHKRYWGHRIAREVKEANEVDDPAVAVWGLTFKPKTDDMRNAPSITIIDILLDEGIKVSAYDPENKNAKRIFKDRVFLADKKYDAVEGADALVMLTEWSEFATPDYEELKMCMRGRQIYDLRNRLEPELVHRHGFNYAGAGRHPPCQK